MARLIGPDEGSRLVYTTGSALGGTAGRTATIYTDAAATTPADILTYPGGATIANSAVSIDAYSRLPLFQFPDGVDTVYAVVSGGPATPIYARADDRLDALASELLTLTIMLGD